MEVFRQEYWSGLPFHPPRDLPDPGVQPVGSFTSSATWEPLRLSKTFLLKCGAALSRFLDSLSFPEKSTLKIIGQGLPWWSRGWDFVFV